MYKDIVIKKRVWMPEDEIDVYQMFEDHDFELEPFEIESTIVDFNGRIPIQDGVKVNEWVTNGFQLIKHDCAEIVGESEREITIEQIYKLLNHIKVIQSDVLPTGIYEGNYNVTAIKFSDGEKFCAINCDYFQYIYEGNYEYDLFVGIDEADYMTGLVLKRDGLVCGYVMGMAHLMLNLIWQRPYSLADVEALSTIQGDPV